MNKSTLFGIALLAIAASLSTGMAAYYVLTTGKQLPSQISQTEGQTFTLGETIYETSNYRYNFHGIQQLWVLAQNYNYVLTISQHNKFTSTESNMQLTFNQGDVIHIEGQAFKITAWDTDSITLIQEASGS